MYNKTCSSVSGLTQFCASATLRDTHCPLAEQLTNVNVNWPSNDSLKGRQIM